MITRFLHVCEDTLTASVFGSLLSLPLDLFWQILHQSCDGHDLPATCGESIEVHPFPNWDASDTANVRYVVPDLFLRFADFDLIIEAKLWDYGMQSHHQWQNQLIAYRNEFSNESRDLHYLAMGGVHQTASEILTFTRSLENQEVTQNQIISMARWSQLLKTCQNHLQDLQNLRLADAQIKAHQRILQDLITTFSAHGFSTGKWFEDFSFATCQTSTFVQSQLLARTLNFRLS